MPQAKPTPGTGQSSETETAQVLYIIRARIDTGRSRGARQLTRDIRALKRAEAEIVRLRAALDQPLAAQPVEAQRVRPTQTRIREIYAQACMEWGGKGDLNAFFVSFAKLLLDEVGIKPISKEQSS